MSQNPRAAVPPMSTQRLACAPIHAETFEATSADELARVYSTMSTKFVGEKKQTEIAFIFAGIGALIAMVAAGLSVWWFGRVA